MFEADLEDGAEQANTQATRRNGYAGRGRMTTETTVEYHHRSACQRAKNVEGTCGVLPQSEVDIAFGFSYGWLTPRL